MAITKASAIDKITIREPYNRIALRTATVIVEDGVELATTYAVKVITPGTLDSSDNLVDTDMSGYSAEIQGVAAAVWTDAIKNSWKTHMISIK